MQSVRTALGPEACESGARPINKQVLPDMDEEQGGCELAPIVASLLGPQESRQRYASLRLDSLVSRCLSMSETEANVLLLLAADQPAPNAQSPEAFHDTLLDVIRQQKLHVLFSRTERGEFHRGIIPSAYNERTGEVYAQEMARWRADYRDMAPERQMMAATIVWLYQSGPDSTWLRRVPCTWLATEALNYMRDAGCMGAWMRLLATYPGW